MEDNCMSQRFQQSLIKCFPSPLQYNTTSALDPTFEMYPKFTILVRIQLQSRASSRQIEVYFLKMVYIVVGHYQESPISKEKDASKGRTLGH